jgi:hypothetical protein
VSPWLWKGPIIIGLVTAFVGLTLMIGAYRVQVGNKAFDHGHRVQKPKYYWLAWVLTVAGYLLQIAGVFLS